MYVRICLYLYICMYTHTYIYICVCLCMCAHSVFLAIGFRAGNDTDDCIITGTADQRAQAMELIQEIIDA